MAINVNMIVDQGSDFSVEIELTDNVGEPYDLTGAEICAQMKRSFYSKTFHEISTAIVGDEVNGVIELGIDSETTMALRDGRYVYDVVVKKDGKKKRVIEGIVTLTPMVTGC